MNRAAEIEALLKSLPAQTAQEYRDAAKKRTDAEGELKSLKASFEKKSAELETLIAAQEKRLEDIRLDARLAKLPQDKVSGYRAKKARLDAVNAELKAWLDASPERSDDNMKKFTAWRDEIAAIEKELAALLETK